jgi:hypothetical protein
VISGKSSTITIPPTDLLAARAIQIAVPSSLLAFAAEVIE